MFPSSSEPTVLAYHAALLDTEGSLAFSRNGTVRYTVEQVGYDYLLAARRQAGVGTVARQGAGREHVTRFQIACRAHLAAYLIKLQPYANKKKDEIEVALQLLQGKIDVDTARRRVVAIRNAYRR